jgi:hypothetical protein
MFSSPAELKNAADKTSAQVSFFSLGQESNILQTNTKSLSWHSHSL